MSGSLRLLPLGGLGEIGMNCMAIEHDGAIVVVDCGVTFPNPAFGTDVLCPDFGWLEERKDRVRAVVLTHGHEDHIGALPFFLQRIPVPVYGPRYALSLVRERLAEHEIEGADLRLTAPRRSFGEGPFEIEPLEVNHSIPDSTALVIRCAAGVVVHSGDFKIGNPGPDGPALDEPRFRELGNEGVDLLLSDSTNVDVLGEETPPDEPDAARAIERLVGEVEGRAVVALFSSNVARFASVVAAARATRRRVCLFGRSVRTHAEIATALGLLPSLAPFLVMPEDARRVPRNELLVIATGTQGEAPAALARLARREHPDLELDPGDTVLLSSRIIPGFEKTVFEITNALERQGVRVVDRRDEPSIHVSGHATRREQEALLRLVRPSAFVPVHGAFHHLDRHAALARDENVGSVDVIENGMIVELRDGALRRVGSVELTPSYVENGRLLPPEVVTERARLAEEGSVSVALRVGHDLRLRARPAIATRGLPRDPQDHAFCEAASRHLARTLGRERFDDLDALRRRAERATARFFAREGRGRPLVTAIVVEDR